MPPFALVCAGIVGGFAVLRWAYRTMVQVNRELEALRVGQRSDGGGEIKTLKQDPVTGAYRPD